MRIIWRCAVALLVVSAGVLLLSPPVHAMSDRRLQAASCAMKLVNRNVTTETDPDINEIYWCLDNAGFQAQISPATHDAVLDSLESFCTQIAAANNVPSDLAPGDLVEFRRDGALGNGDSGERSLALYTGAGEIIGWSAAKRSFVARPLAEIIAGNSAANPGNTALGNNRNNLDANLGFTKFFRIKPQFWKGSNDIAWTPGKISLADPAVVAHQLQWMAENPVDVNPSFTHIAVKDFLTLVQALGASLQFIVGSILHIAGTILGQVLIAVGIPRAAVIAIGAFFTRKFDGTGINRVLTIGLIAFMNPCFGLMVVLGNSRWFQSIPVVGKPAAMLARGIWTVASFAVFVVTGIGVGETSLFSILTDTATLPFLWLKPFGLLEAGGKLAMFADRVGARTHFLADLTDWTADTVSLRPTVLMQDVRFGKQIADQLASGKTLAGIEYEHSYGAGPRLLNLLMLPLRPGSVLNESLAQLNYAIGWLGRKLSIEIQWQWLTELGKVLHAAGDSVHAHGGVATLGSAVAGTPPKTVTTPQFTTAHELSPSTIF